ncbi:MAG: DUF1365 domain-containing protein [Bdellovibrionales bacterium]|nr:DUF1365 domain-containing protein [Bdellovibrionales bacterium]
MKALFKARIYHKRFLPRVNEFIYTGYYIKFSLSEVQNLNSLFFSVNKFNLFSFFEKDHGPKDGSSLIGWASDILNKSGIKDFSGTVTLQTFPRVLGYVFNPVSFWHCYDQDKLVAVICEVNNTFGESHNYVITKDPSQKINVLNKYFHVSPFYGVEGNYEFDLRRPDHIVINYHLNAELQLSTGISGKEISFNDKNLLKLFFRYPFYTLTIVALIHYQALKLFLKRIRFYSKPEKGKSEVTYE